MPSNSEMLLQKGDMTLGEITSNGGLLTPEQASTFIRKLILSPTMLSQVRRVTMPTPQRNIDKIGFASRIMRKGVQSTALTQGQRSKVTTEQIVLTTKEIIAEVWIPYDVMEDNIERATAANNEASNSGPDGLRQTIIELIAERAASDIEELILTAYTSYTSGDSDEQDYLSLFNGYLADIEANGNELDMGGAGVSKTMFKKAMQALPKQYLRNRASMRHFIAVDQEIELRDWISNRATGLGDSNLTGNAPINMFGTPVQAVNHMPSAEGLFTDPQNLIFGVHREVSMEFDKDIRTRSYQIVLTARVGTAVEETDAAVHFDSIGAVE